MCFALQTTFEISDTGDRSAKLLSRTPETMALNNLPCILAILGILLLFFLFLLYQQILMDKANSKETKKVTQKDTPTHQKLPNLILVRIGVPSKLDYASDKATSKSPIDPPENVPAGFGKRRRR